MDKIKKALAKFSDKERKTAKLLLTKIYKRQLAGLNIQKLTGYADIYRVKKGSLRIIYRETGSDFVILKVARRSEKTYHDF